MQRISALWQASPRKVVGALFILSLAAMMAVASGASFTSTSANAGNIVTAGILTHGNTKAPGAILSVSKLTPNHSDSGYTDITNTGDVPGVFTLTKSNVVNSDATNPLGSKLDLVIEDLGDPASPAAAGAGDVVYTGKLGAMGAVTMPLPLAAGEAHRYLFTVTFPEGGKPAGPNAGDNRYQGDDVHVDYAWEAVTP
jgi:spore coat-associated protein N